MLWEAHAGGRLGSPGRGWDGPGRRQSGQRSFRSLPWFPSSGLSGCGGDRTGWVGRCLGAFGGHEDWGSASEAGLCWAGSVLGWVSWGRWSPGTWVGLWGACPVLTDRLSEPRLQRGGRLTGSPETLRASLAGSRRHLQRVGFRGSELGGRGGLPERREGAGGTLTAGSGLGPRWPMGDLSCPSPRSPECSRGTVLHQDLRGKGPCHPVLPPGAL